MRSAVRQALCTVGILCAFGSLAATAAQAEEAPYFGTETGFIGSSGAAVFSMEGAGWKYKTSNLAMEKLSKKSFKNITINFNEGIEGCNNSGESGLVLKNFKSRVGYINKSKKEVGMIFEPREVEFEKEWTPCRFYEGVWRGFESHYSGDLIAKITPINTKTTKFTLSFTTSSPHALEGEKEQPVFSLQFPSKPFPVHVTMEVSLIAEKETELVG
jgi:hypothetical protein